LHIVVIILSTRGEIHVMRKIKMIDPPKGWLYNFPKEIPDDVENIGEWLSNNGYPKKMIDLYGDQFYVRMWYEEIE
jgi:hypothetical protein